MPDIFDTLTEERPARDIFDEVAERGQSAVSSLRTQTLTAPAPTPLQRVASSIPGVLQATDIARRLFGYGLTTQEMLQTEKYQVLQDQFASGQLTDLPSVETWKDWSQPGVDRLANALNQKWNAILGAVDDPRKLAELRTESVMERRRLADAAKRAGSHYTPVESFGSPELPKVTPEDLRLLGAGKTVADVGAGAQQLAAGLGEAVLDPANLMVPGLVLRAAPPLARAGLAAAGTAAGKMFLGQMIVNAPDALERGLTAALDGDWKTATEELGIVGMTALFGAHEAKPFLPGLRAQINRFQVQLPEKPVTPYVRGQKPPSYRAPFAEEPPPPSPASPAPVIIPPPFVPAPAGHAAPAMSSADQPIGIQSRLAVTEAIGSRRPIAAALVDDASRSLLEDAAYTLKGDTWVPESHLERQQPRIGVPTAADLMAEEAAATKARELKGEPTPAEVGPVEVISQPTVEQKLGQVPAVETAPVAEPVAAAPTPAPEPAPAPPVSATTKPVAPEARQPWEMTLRETLIYPEQFGADVVRGKYRIGSTGDWFNLSNERPLKKAHKAAVAQAIARGDITSHPDYPELGAKAAAAAPAVTPTMPVKAAVEVTGGKVMLREILGSQNAATLATVKLGDEVFTLGVRRMGGGQRDLSITISEKGKTGRVLTRVHESDTRSVADLLDYLKKELLAEGAEVIPEFTTGEQRLAAEKTRQSETAGREFRKRFGKDATGADIENFDQLKNLEAKQYKTANDEKMIGILQDRIVANPDKWRVGDGVGWRVDRQTNRGYQIERIDPEQKLALVRPVADTGLTVTGGGMEGIGKEWVHIADLVRDKKYDAPSPVSTAAPAVKPAERVSLTVEDKQWAAGTRFKETNGDPQIVYRGLKKGEGFANTEGQSWWAIDASYAEKYAGPDGRIIIAILKATKPIGYNTLFSRLKRALSKEGLSDEEINSELDAELPDKAAMIRKAKELGYDAFFSDRVSQLFAEPEIHIWSPEQVRVLGERQVTPAAPAVTPAEAPINLADALKLAEQRKVEGKSQVSVAQELSGKGLSDADATGIAEQVFKARGVKAEVLPDVVTEYRAPATGKKSRWVRKDGNWYKATTLTGSITLQKTPLEVGPFVDALNRQVVNPKPWQKVRMLPAEPLVPPVEPPKPAAPEGGGPTLLTKPASWWTKETLSAMSRSELDSIAKSLGVTPTGKPKPFYVADILAHAKERLSEKKPITGGEPEPISRGPSGGLGRAEEPSGSTRRSIFTAEQRRVAEVQAEEPVSQPFITSERVQQLLDKIGVPSAERYLPRRLLGIFKHRSENIRVKALADAFTAAHEASHYISHTFGIAKRLIQDTTHGERLRRRLTDIYTEFYPGAKRSHKLSKRIEEGIAVLMENYAYEPTKIMEKYPDLVATFIKPTGKYYHPKFTELLNGIGDIVGEHARLTPEQQIGARIVRGEEVLKRDTGFTWRQRLVWELFNAAEPLKRWAKKAGVSETIADPTVWYYSWLDKGTLIANWITGDHTVRFTPDGKIIREPGTIKTYGRMIEGKEKEFDAYLVSRRVVEDHNRLADLKQQIVERETALEEGGLEPSELREARLELDSVKQEAQRLADVLARDNINLSAATAVVNKFEPVFQKPVAVFDAINERLVRLAADHGLIKQAWADELLARKGYASFLKFVTDDLAGGDGNPYSLTSQSKAKAFKERTGNELDIVSPVFNQAVAIHEVVAKAMQNDVWRKVLDLGEKNPEIARRFEVIETVRLPDETGRITYPQDRDPNLLKVWKNGQRVFVKAAPEFRALVDFMRPQDMGLVSQLLTIPSSVFTRLTTSANPIFAVGNLTVDQVSALMQTKTGYKPGVEPVKGLMQFVREFSKLTPEDQKVMKTFLEAGGKRTTLAASLRETTPEKFITGLEKPHGTAAKMMSVVDSGLNLLELPSNFSEYLSRFGEYKRSLDRGDAPIVALYRASEVTTPFKLRGHLGGKVGQVWVRSIPYLNAALQVSYKFGRAVAENPTRVATVAAGALATTFMTAIAVMQASTDKQKRLLRNLESGDLGRYLYFPLPDGKRLTRFRIPEHLGALTAPVYLFTMAAYDRNLPNFNTLLDASTQWIPDALNVTEPKKAALNLIPTALKPSVQVAANIKTYPHIAPIVPEYVAENTTPADQYTAYTSKVAVGLGKILGLSPSKIEFWVRNQFGAVGGMLMGKFQSTPIVRGESEIGLSGRLYNEFYEQRQVLAQQTAKLKARPQAFTASEGYQIRSGHAAFEKMAADLAKLRKQKTLDERTRQQVFQRIELLLRTSR